MFVIMLVLYIHGYSQPEGMCRVCEGHLAQDSLSDPSTSVLGVSSDEGPCRHDLLNCAFSQRLPRKRVWSGRPRDQLWHADCRCSCTEVNAPLAGLGCARLSGMGMGLTCAE